MIPCPKCSSENDDEALYCDQCATPVAPSAQGAVLDMSCPACGGEVREVPSMAAVCQGCGIHLGAGGAAEACLPCQDAGAASPAQDQESAEAEKSPCPVCETPNAVGAARCAACGIAFKKLTRPVACPQCSAESMDDKCGCGAVLTLEKLLEYVDDSIRVVCPVCKQLFSAKKDLCSDCGAALRSAGSLKKYAATAGRRP